MQFPKLERTVQMARPGEKTESKIISIGPVTKTGEPQKPTYVCACFVDLIDSHETKFKGEDPLEVISRAIAYISKLIYGHEEDGWTLYWRFPGDHCGFCKTEIGTSS